MAQLTKTTCPRCGGSGNYSFHLVYGTVCFKCNGSGFIMVDAVKEDKKRANAAIKANSQIAKRETMIRVYREVVVEMNALYGPFDVETELGIDKLNQATYRATGKAIRTIRDERVKA